MQQKETIAANHLTC